MRAQGPWCFAPGHPRQGDPTSNRVTFAPGPHHSSSGPAREVTRPDPFGPIFGNSTKPAWLGLNTGVGDGFMFWVASTTLKASNRKAGV